MEMHIAATRNGLLSTGRPPAWAMVFNTSFGPNFSRANLGDSADRPTAARRGRLRSAFLTLLSGERSMWQATAIFLSAAEIPAAVFGAFGRATHRTRL